MNEGFHTGIFSYQIIMKTPMGKKNGTLILYEVENSMCGTLNILGNHIAIQNGIIVENICCFSGEFYTPMGEIAFTAEGEINQQTLLISIRTDKCDMSITGKRMKETQNNL